MSAARIFAAAFAALTLGAVATADVAVAQTTAPIGKNNKVPHHGRPLHYTRFPKIHNWDSLVITLSRGPCFGTCPVYDVSIHGDGSVTYNGIRFVGTTGEKHSQIARRDVKSLYAQFKRSDFFWLYDNYQGRVTDLPSYRMSISYDGRKKEVVDYAGQMIGIPEVVVQLEHAVDRVSGADKLVIDGLKTEQ